MPKKATPPPDRPLKMRGWLVCKDCSTTAEFHSLGSAAKDGGWPMHRCGYDVKPFTRWTDKNPRHDTCTYVPEPETPDDQDQDPS
jgi:hypothetical protein